MAEQADPGTGDYDKANSGTTQDSVQAGEESAPRTLTDLIDDIGREAFSRYLDHTRPFRESSADEH